MEMLTDRSISNALNLCLSNKNYHVLVVTKYIKQSDLIFKELCFTGHSKHACHPYRISYDNGSSIEIMSEVQEKRYLCGKRADLVLLDSDLYQEDILSVFMAIEAKNINFKLLNKGE